jgi:hypothetical protein
MLASIHGAHIQIAPLPSSLPPRSSDRVTYHLLLSVLKYHQRAFEITTKHWAQQESSMIVIHVDVDVSLCTVLSALLTIV